MDVSGFMHKYYDWADFEVFVKGLYEDEGNVTVDRDVTEVDRYGATRQTDVKIVRRTRLHSFTTLVECKRWKDPVSRDRIDVLASSIEALGATNGAMFTTTGFEEGAIAYAKGKGIELFVVRDLTSEEWGLPGRHVSLHVQLNAGEFRNIGFDAQAIALVEDFSQQLAIGVEMSEAHLRDPRYDLYSVKTGALGCNLVGILADAHGMLLTDLGRAVGLIDGGAVTMLEITAQCEIDFSRTAFKQLRLPEAAVRIERIRFAFVARLDQFIIDVDRGKDLDFAVMVESRVTDLRLTAHRRAGDAGIVFADAARSNGPTIGDDRPVENGSLIQVRCAPWVGLGATQSPRQGRADQLISVVVETEGTTPKLSLVAEPRRQ